MELREKIRRIVRDGMLGVGEWETGKAATEVADAILAIPELADALRACEPGGELDVYRANCGVRQRHT